MRRISRLPALQKLRIPGDATKDTAGLLLRLGAIHAKFCERMAQQWSDFEVSAQVNPSGWGPVGPADPGTPFDVPYAHYDKKEKFARAAEVTPSAYPQRERGASPPRGPAVLRAARGD